VIGNRFRWSLRVKSEDDHEVLVMQGCRRAGFRLAAMSEGAGLDPEDLKIITLARSARARVAAAEGAAVRDETGRTYAAATVALPSFQLSALRLAVAMAVSSGASGLEAAALVGEAERPAPADLAALGDFGGQVTVFVAAPDGTLRDSVTA
jgi:hypothetical protein